jgi:hypothetical protein
LARNVDERIQHGGEHVTIILVNRHCDICGQILNR